LSISKAWNWNEVENEKWLNPCEESYFLSNRWKNLNYKKLLDFGCGLGRHSIFFTKEGFDVSAFDLSSEAVNHLNDWAKKEKLVIETQIADMLALPYPDCTFDCLFAHHVVSHTDTPGIKKIMNEIKRIIRPGGEIFITFCSKETWSFVEEAGYPKIDENTVIKTDDGPEKDIPHFFVNLDDIIKLFADAKLELVQVRHIDDCYFDGGRGYGKHYFIIAKNKGAA